MTEDEEAVVSMRWYALSAEDCRLFCAAMVGTERTTQTSLIECFRLWCSKHKATVRKTIVRMETDKFIGLTEQWRGKPDMLWIAEHGTPKGGLRFDAGPDGFTVERNE